MIQSTVVRLTCTAPAVTCLAGEFGLFVKQLLYFDRYTRILAPELRVFDDSRVNWRAAAGSASSSFDGPEVISGGGSGYMYN